MCICVCGIGMDEHTAQSEGQTALHYASQRGHAEVVKALVAAGAKSNALNVRAYVVGW
jgi:ankyrin repeat protein